MNMKRAVGMALLSSTMVCAAGTGWAEQQASVLEEIMVTAQKRSQDLQDVSIAVSAFSGDYLEQRGWTDITQVASQTPNLDIKYVWGNSMPVATIRGVGMNDFQANSKPGVAFYVDEVYLPSIAMMGLQLFDVERLEVLKGPQGTLYGRNTNGGAVNYITRRPTRNAEGYLRGEMGRFERTDVEGGFGGPLTDTLSGRVSFLARRQGEGYILNRTSGKKNGEVEIWAARAQLLWEPTESAQVLFNVHGGADRSQPMYFQHVGYWNPGATRTTPASERFCAAVLAGRRDPNTCVDITGYSDTDGNPWAGEYSDRNGVNFDNQTLDNVNVGGSIRVDYEFANNLALTSVTAIEDYDRYQPKESDASPFNLTDLVFGSKIRSYAQEFRLASPGDQAFTWIVGVNYADESVSEDPARVLFNEDLLAGRRPRVEYEQDQWQAAVFAHTEWALNDRWKLTVGGRLIREEIEFSSESSYLLPPSYSYESRQILATVPNALVPGTKTDEAWTGRIALAYEPTSDLMLYASVGRGYKGGGFNGGFVANPALWVPYDPEEVLAYELGLKSEFLDRRLIVNAAAFFTEYENMQATTTRPSANGSSQNFLANLTKATIKGLEIEVSARPVPQFEVRAGLGLLDTTNEDPSPLFDGPFAPLVMAPRELANSPDYSLSLAASYDFFLQSGNTVQLSTDYNRTGKNFKEVQNNIAVQVPEQDLWNARLTWRPDRGNWSASLWGKNLSDRANIVDTLGSPPTSGWGVIVYGLPRTYGISAEYNWR